MTEASWFDGIAKRYERDAVVQRSAADVLFDLLVIRPGERVLDVGCGTGHLTEHIASLCGGEVVGVDPSPGMIAEARRRFPARRFEQLAAEALPFAGEFDVVFSNSALQWFREPVVALERCCAALRPGGRMGVQAPATAAFCPAFVEAMREVARDPETAETFGRWKSPWLFLETADAYAALFERAGLRVRLARLDPVSGSHDLDGAMRVFESGAAAGYLGAACYQGPMSDAYAARVRALMRAELARRAGADGRVELEFRRVFVIAERAT